MRSGRADAQTTTRLAALVVGYVAVLMLVYWFSVRTVLGREFGDAALRGALLTQAAVSDTVDRVLDIVSAASLMGALALVATIALVRLARVRGLAALGLMVAANATTWLLKEQLLVRPDLGLDEYTPATLNSLPSGHTTAVMSAVAAVLIVLPRRLRPAAAVAGGVFTFLTAVATMVAGWHRASDSVAALLVVGAWTALAVLVVVLLSEPAAEDDGQPYAAARWLGAFALGSFILGFVMVLGLDAASGFRDSAFGQAFALFAGACLIASALTGVLLVTAWALELMDSRGRPAAAPDRPASP